MTQSAAFTPTSSHLRHLRHTSIPRHLQQYKYIFQRPSTSPSPLYRLHCLHRRHYGQRQLALPHAPRKPDTLSLLSTQKIYDNVKGNSRLSDFPSYFLGEEAPDPQLREWRRTTRDIMTSHIEILSSPTADTPGSCLLLHFDSTRYIFGQVSEGTQRMMVQRKTPVSRIDTMFLTGPTRWDSYGGLLGMILTIAGVVADQKLTMNLSAQEKKSTGKQRNKNKAATLTDKSLHIFGPENLTYLLASARRFIFRQSILLSPHEVRTAPNDGKRDPDYEDCNIKVWFLPIRAGDVPSTPPDQLAGVDRIPGEPNERDFSDMKDEERLKFLREVVTHMFESNWSMDSLTKTTLHQARLPAKLFVKKEDGELVKYEGPLPGDEDEVPEIEVYVRQPWPGAKVTTLPPANLSDQALCYIASTFPRRGKFDVVAAKKLGVAVKDYKKLTAGESVEGADGTTVTPNMVLGDTLPGHSFAVLHIPDVSYIDSLLSRDELQGDAADELAAAYWFLGPGVALDPRIRKFIADHSKPKHYVSAPDILPNYLALESAAQLGIWLRMVDDKRFHTLAFKNDPQVANSMPEGSIPALPGQTMGLSPRLHYDKGKPSPFLDTRAAVEKYPYGVRDIATKAAAVVADPVFRAKVEEAEKDIPNRDAEIITLGTGSALPSKYRNVSATLLRVPGVGNYLFDCGENTLGQMKRCFGAELPQILRDLKLIWISHLHADHHLGTASVIRAWDEGTKKDGTKNAKLAVASHINMHSWLKEHSVIEDFGYASGLRTDRVRFYSLQVPYEQDKKVSKMCAPVTFSTVGPDTPQKVKEGHIGLEKLEATLVDHCYGAMAVCLTFPSGLKVAYSGDCRPSKEFANMARGATLLIHEATFSDEFPDEAQAKKHCTISEAMDVASVMRARRVMLTHFSQRYPKIATLGDVGDKSVKDQAVLFAFDHMRVELGGWRDAQEYWDAIKELVEEKVEESRSVLEK